MEPTVLLKETRSYRPFKSSEEYLYAMREDLAEWINLMYPELMINVDNFMDRLDTGVVLCKHANNVRSAAEEYVLRRQARQKSMTKSMTTGLAGPILSMGAVQCLVAAKSGTFFARDNVSNFISWCRKSLQIFECLLFETDDLIMRKNEKHVILCLLEVARRGAKFGMLAPMLVQMERQIDREIAAEMKASGVGKYTEETGLTMITGTELEFDSDTEDEDLDDKNQLLIYGPQPQIVTNDLKSLDEMVRDLVEKCTCPSQFPMIRVSEGKYRIGETKVLIFVRILRSHVMVRVGGGWDTLSHYLDKHDPCRCKAQHRSSTAARLVTKPSLQNNGIELHKAQVFYERSPPAVRKFQAAATPTNNGNNLTTKNLTPTSIRARSRSRSPAVQRKSMFCNVPSQTQEKSNLLASPRLSKRSVSPSPKQISDFKKKQVSIELPIKCSENGTHISRKAINLSNEENIELPTYDNTNSNGENKFENVSDNGSEISDEGYRSLVQFNGMKATKKTLNAQISDEDSKVNGSLDQSWSREEPSTEVGSMTESKMEELSCDKFYTQLENSDDTPVADISNTTGLRKTGFSEVLYDDMIPEEHRRSTSIINTKLIRTPQPVRRKSIDNSSVAFESISALTTGSRKIPHFRSSMRKSSSTSQQDISGAKENTWNGRSIGATKKRPSLSTDTFSALQKSHRNASSGEIDLRFKGNRNNSPTKNANKDQKQSALAQQLLEAAGRAKNDAQILEKMKEILTTYSSKNDYDPAEFTSAWINDYGQSDDSRCISKQSSLDSENPSNARLSQTIVSPRRNDKFKGLSKIPAPIRSNTQLY